MSLLKSIKQQLGLGPAAENHFWDGSVANQLSLKRGTPDAPGATVMQVVDGKAFLKTIHNLLPMTAIPAAGLNVPNIPAEARRVTVHCKLVSNTGVGVSGIRLGTSAGLLSTNYTSDYAYIEHAAPSFVGFSTDGFFTSSNVAANSMQGKFVLELADEATNTWNCTFMGTNSVVQVGFAFGTVVLPGPLTQLSMVAFSGAFDSGQMSVDWEM